MSLHLFIKYYNDKIYDKPVKNNLLKAHLINSGLMIFLLFSLFVTAIWKNNNYYDENDDDDQYKYGSEYEEEKGQVDPLFFNESEYEEVNESLHFLLLWLVWLIGKEFFRCSFLGVWC